MTQANASDLWVQGGTRTEPVADPDTYAFGALRCATDNVNGDNVEYVAYPTGKNHVFCFAYYVSPAPTAGTIKIVKTLTPESAPTQEIPFQGNISYAAGGAFTISASGKKAGSISFIRAGGRTWSFKEIVPAGLVLNDLSCSSAKGTSTWTITKPAADVALAAGDTVTCTFANGPFVPGPEPGGLIIRKVTRGGLGTFPFSVTGKADASLEATTTEEGVAAEAQPEGSPKFPPGDYRIEETLPSTAHGDWKLSSVFCNTNTKQIIDGTAVNFTVPDQGGVCTFTNTFTPAGSIILRKSTIGATGTFKFAIRPQFGEVTELTQSVTTTSTLATDSKRATGDPTNHIPLGVYTVQETTASAQGDNGLWRVDSVICDGVPQQSFEGGLRIELTTDKPDRDCTVTNELIKSPDPPEPPEPEPPTPPTPNLAAPADSVPGAAGLAAERSRGRGVRRQPRRRAADHQGRPAAPDHAGPERALAGDRPQPRAGGRPRRHARRAVAGGPGRAQAAPEPGTLPRQATALLRHRPAAAGPAGHGHRDGAPAPAGADPQRRRRQLDHPPAHLARQAGERHGRGRARGGAAVHRLTGRATPAARLMGGWPRR